jgi:hypothetical protein
MTNGTRIAIVLLGLAQGLAGCSAPPPPSAPSPSAPSGPQPAILTITPNTGSTYGGSLVAIVTTIERGATASIGGARSMGYSPTDPAKIFVVSPPHAAGSVDVVVTNPAGGATQKAIGAYTYVDPESFDLNGAWSGVTFDGSDMSIEFTVRGNLLSNVHCIDATDKRLDIGLSAPIVNGKVEFVGDAGRFSAWVASASEAAGTIDMAPCSGGRPWQALRKQ